MRKQRNGKSNNDFKGKGRGRNANKNNYQDKAEINEYDKGYKAGKRSDGKFNNNKRNKLGGPIDAGDSYMNDPIWHEPQAGLIKSTCSIPFNEIPGLPIDPNYVKSELKGAYFLVPGILTFDILPTFGKNADAKSPYNQAMFNEYNWLRQATSGTSYYQAADLGIVQGAIMSAYSCYAEMCRVYGCLGNFNPLNNYTPQSVVRALGFNYNSLVSNKAQFRTQINLFADALHKVCLPLDIKYMDRQLTLLNHLYMDGESVKSQYYVFRALRYYKFVEANPTTPETIPSSLTLVSYPDPIGNAGITYEQCVDMIDTLMAPLMNNTLVQKVSAETLKAFGVGKLYTVHPIDETYTVTPVYSKEILSQIENAQIIGATSVEANITQDLTNLETGSFVKSSYILSNLDVAPGVASKSMTYSADWNPWTSFQMSNYIVNMHHENVTPEDVMEATRLMGVTLINADSQLGKIYYAIDECPSEVVLNCHVWTMLENGNISQSSVRQNLMTLRYNGQTSAVAYNHTADLMTLSAFDWHPKVWTIAIDLSKDDYDQSIIYKPTSISINGIMLDYENYTTVSQEQMQLINRVSTLGLFKIRSMPNA